MQCQSTIINILLYILQFVLLLHSLQCIACSTAQTVKYTAFIIIIILQIKFVYNKHIFRKNETTTVALAAHARRGLMKFGVGVMIDCDVAGKTNENKVGMSSC